MKTVRSLLLSILLVVLFVLAPAAHGQGEKRIGVIMTGDIPYYRGMHEAFVAELNKRAGGAEKIEIILQRPFPDAISWSNAARKLIAFDVDLIVSYGAPATQAVIQEKGRIPLVYAGLYDPEHGALLGQGMTGCGFKVPLSSIIRYFKGIKTVNTIGIVFSSVEEDSVRQYEAMKGLAEKQNLKTERFDIRSRLDLDKLKTTKADAVFITGSSIAHLWLADIMAILKNAQVPAADILPDSAEAGLLMTLFQPSQAQGQMAAEMVWRILRGDKPGNISAHTFRDTELVFNQVEAKHLGITFPIQLLMEATRLVQ